MNQEIIKLNDICFSYEEEVTLRHINLEINKGETVALMGSNGCGKTTLLKLLNGLIFPDEGSYYFEDKEISEKTLKEQKFSKWLHQKLGFIFQNADVQLFCGSVYEEIAFGPIQMGLSPEEVKQRCEDVIALLDIEKLRKRAPYHLSGGEKRKVAFACILSMNPDVLVMDEPLAGLDAASQRWLRSFLQSFKAAGKTLIISTHDETLARSLADRIIHINENHAIERVEIVDDPPKEEHGPRRQPRP